MTSSHDDLATEVAKLGVIVQATNATLGELVKDMRDANRNNAKEHAEVRAELAAIKLDLAKHYATTVALERVEERAAERHKFAMDRLEAVADVRLRAHDELEVRVDVLERADDKRSGWLAGSRGVIVAAAAVVGCAGTVIGAVAALT